MNLGTGIRAIVVVAGIGICGVSQAFVGTIAVGLGQMDRGIGAIETSFAADATIETEEITAQGRIHYRPGMVRDEMNLGGHQMVTIRRFDLDKVWILMGQGMYMEAEPGQGSDQAPEYRLISREVIGPETVNGIPTTKYKSVYESADGKFGGFTWYTDDNIAVKGFLVHDASGERQRIKFEFTSLERGAQAESLFEIPAGYRKFNAGGFPGMQEMQGMQGMPDGSEAEARTTDRADEDDDFVGDVAGEAQKAATDTAKEETRRGVSDAVREGFGKLFGR